MSTARQHGPGWFAGALAAAAVGLAGTTVPAAADPPPPTGAPTTTCGDERARSVVRPQETARDWDPLTDSKWAFADGSVLMTERGTAPTGPRRPFEYAVVTKGREFTNLRYQAEVRVDEPVTRNDRVPSAGPTAPAARSDVPSSMSTSSATGRPMATAP